MAETAPAEALCQHNDAAVAFAQRDVAAAARKVLRTPEESSKHAALIAEVARLREEVASVRERIRVSGPRCNFCLERDGRA